MWGSGFVDGGWGSGCVDGGWGREKMTILMTNEEVFNENIMNH